MKKIYVVVHGQYPHDIIYAIFDSEELAEIYKSAFIGDEEYTNIYIHEWIINPKITELKKGCKEYFVRMDKEGHIKEIKVDSLGFCYRVCDSGVSFTYDDRYINCHCFASNEKQAIKIANKKRLMYLDGFKET